MKSTNTKSNFGARGWLLVILCILGCFMSSALAGSLNVSATYFNTLYGWSQTSMMLPVSIGTVIGAIISISGAKIVVRVSPRRAVFICTLIYAVCFFLNPRSTSMGMFYLTYILGNVSSFFWAMIFNPVLVANWFPRKTGLVMGWVTMGMPLGAGFSAFLIRAVYVRVGFCQAFYPYAILAVALGVIYLIVIRDFPTECGCYPDNDKSFDPKQLEKEEAEIKAMREKSPWTPKRVFTTKEFWFIWISVGFLGFCAGFLAQVVTTFTSFGMDAQIATYCMLGVVIIACFGSFLLGKVDAWFGPKRAIIIGCFIVYAMVIIEQFNFLPAKMVAFVLVGVIMGGSSNFLLSMCMRTWGPTNSMSVFRFAQPLMSLCTGFAATIISIIATAFGGDYDNAFLFIGVLGIVSLIMILNVKKENIEKKEKRFLELDSK
ncbi:MAG: MFS transporter [Clostridiales bacterium]|nr:MFS transporter [Clostridiales bacterium]